MTKNRLPQLLALLVVLIGVAYVTGVFEGDPSTVDVPAIDVPVDEVDRIRLTGPVALELERQAGSWRLVAPVQATADSATVTALLESLRGAELASVVSTSPDRHARYGVDSTGLRIQLSWGDEAFNLVVAPGPDFQSNYVRLQDEPTVYASRLRIAAPDDRARWRDRVILTAGAVTSARVSTPEGAFAVTPGPGGWQIATGDGVATPADSAAVGRWLARFGNLRADGFFWDMDGSSVADSATHVVSLTTASGRAAEIRARELDGAVAAVLVGEDAVYRLFSSRLANLAPGVETLITQ